MKLYSNFLIIVLLAVIVLLPSILHSKTFRVPQDYATIQSAINVSHDGDTVLVAPGNYNEDVTISKKDIYLIGEYGADSTFISGYPDGGKGWILFKNETKSVLKGFTVNKKHDATGGILIVNSGSNPTIEKCVFTECYTIGSIILVQSKTDFRNPTRIINCTFTQNVGQGTDLSTAVSVSVSESTVKIENCIFWNSNFENEINFTSSYFLEVSYSNVRGGMEGIGNIDVDPAFVDTINGNFHLDSITPCCNAGNPSSPLDIDFSIADIGAFYRWQCLDTTYLSIDENLSFNFLVAPNPIRDIIHVNLDKTYQKTNIQIYNSIGRLMLKREYSNVDGF